MSSSLLLLIIIVIETALTVPVINTRYGLLKGLVYEWPNSSSSVVAYLGLPYAKPPLNELRFKPPQKLSSNDDFDKTHFDKKPKICPNHHNEPEEMSEDCLYINLYRPNNNETNLATIIYLGHSQFLSDFALKPEYFVRENMNTIMAFVQTRAQNCLGHLYYNTEGNAALMDAVMAAEWVMDNISNFGGNPSNITLAAQGDEGLMAVLALKILNVKGKRISKLIVSSGGQNRPGAVLDRNEALKLTLDLAKIENCNNKTEDLEYKDILECLQKRDWKSLLASEQKLSKDPFLPSVFNYVLDGIIVPIMPQNLPWPPKIDLLVGITENEGSDLVKMALDKLGVESGANPGLTHDDFDALVARLTPDLQPIIRETVKFVYSNWSVLAKDSGQSDEMLVQRFQSLTHLIGDRHVNCPLRDLILGLIRDKNVNASVFRYKFSVINEQRRIRTERPKWMEVTHGDDLDFVFGTPLINEDNYDGNYEGHYEGNYNNYDKRDRAMSRFLIRAWTLFAQTGHPMGLEKERRLIDWPPYTVEDGLHYLHLDSRHHVILMEEPLTEEATNCALWTNLVPKLISNYYCESNKAKSEKKANNDFEDNTNKVLEQEEFKDQFEPLFPSRPLAKFGERSVNFTIVVNDENKNNDNDTKKYNDTKENHDTKEYNDTKENHETKENHDTKEYNDTKENHDTKKYFDTSGTTLRPLLSTTEANIEEVYDPFYLLDFLKAKREQKTLVNP